MQPPRAFVQFRFGAGALLRGSSDLPRGRRLRSALRRRFPRRRPWGGFGLGHPPLYGLDYLLPEIFGVGVHPAMMPHSPTPLQGTLGLMELRASSGFSEVRLY